MHRNTRLVVDAGAAIGVHVEPIEHADSTATAVDAANALGVELAQIVKSLVFSVDGEVVVALVSGRSRLDERRLAAAAGGNKARREDADSVREATGFPIGGVPPFGHQRALRVFIDQDLMQFEVVWAAAGTPNANFSIAPSDLVRATRGSVCELAKRR